MRISKTLLISASASLALAGCVGKAKDVNDVSDFGRTKDDNASVIFSSNSTDLSSLPFYFIGDQTLTAKDVDTIDTNYSKQSAYADFSSGQTFNKKPFGNLHIDLHGRIQTLKGVSYYEFTIAGSGSYNGKNYTDTAANSSTLSPTYKIGVARDINGTVYVFNATQAQEGIDRPIVLNPIGNNKLEIYSWATSNDRSAGAQKLKTVGGGGSVVSTVNGNLPYLDFSVNVPTSAANDYAPFTGTSGTSKLVLANTNTEYHLVRNEFDVDIATGGALGLTARYSATANVDASKHIVFPWRPSTGKAVSLSDPTVPNTTVAATRDIKFANSFPGAYWKSGIGFVEALGQIRDDKVFTNTASTTTATAGGVTTITTYYETLTKADGNTLVGTSVNNGTATTINRGIWTTYVELTPNLPRALVSGYAALPELPYGSN